MPGDATQLRRSRLFRVILGIFLFLQIYDGAIRKWLLPGAEQVVFVAKDLIVIFGLFVWVTTSRGRMPLKMPPYARLFFWMYAGWVLLESFNFHLPNPAVGLWGVKVHLLGACLIVLLASGFSGLADVLRTLARVYPWVVIPVCILAFAQLNSPPESFLNQQVRGGIEGIALFGEEGMVRVAGTFSYLAGMASFVQISVLLGAGLYLLGERSRLFLAGVLFALVALPISGSRAVVVVVAAGVLILLLGAFVSRIVGIRSVMRLIAMLALVLAAGAYTQQAAWEGLAKRASDTTDVDRAFTAFTNAFDYFQSAGLVGFGAGAANLGAVALTTAKPFSWLPAGTGFEEESGRLVLELGALGWALSLFMRFGFLLWGIRLLLTGRTRLIRGAALIGLPLLALGVYQGNGVFAPPLANSSYWFVIGLLLFAQRENKMAGPSKRMIDVGTP